MTSLRRVRRVSLRAPNEALLRRGALLLEDALRTAAWTLDAPGSVVVVRRFDVGAIDPRESPAALSVRIEQRLRALEPHVVPATSPSAERADAVRFRDAVEPAVLLVEHVARSSGPAPWFVARAVPAYRAEAGPRHALRAALAAARDVSEVGVIALLETLLARGAAGALLAALDAGDGPGLLAALGLRWPATSTPVGSTSVGSATSTQVGAAASTPVGSTSVGATSVGSTPVGSTPVGSTPVGSTSVGSTPVGSEQGARRTGPGPLAHARGSGPLAHARGSKVLDPGRTALALTPVGATAVGAAASTPVGPTLPAAPPDLASIAPSFREALAAHVPLWGASDPRSIWLAATALLARAPALRHDPRLASRAKTLAATFATLPEAPTARISARASTQGDAPAAPFSQPMEAEWSAWGGLLFLVPLLERLGMAAFLAEHTALAEVGFPVHVLHDIARRLGAPPGDPILLALGDPTLPLPDVPFTEPPPFARLAGPPPAALRRTQQAFDRTSPPAAGSPSAPFPANTDPRGPLHTLTAFPSPSTPHSSLTAFRIALRRVARRLLGLGLRSLVQRPARVSFTRTHIDVVLDMRRVHLGIRRTGADIDPGFVPWLGRVIHFHYHHGEEPRA